MALTPSLQNRLVWGVKVLLALAFAAAGSAKLAGVPMMVATFEAVGIGQWFRHVTGVIEWGGALMLLLPSTAFFAGLLLGATMLGATISHFTVVPGSPLGAIVLGLLCALVVWHQRPARFRQS